MPRAFSITAEAIATETKRVDGDLAKFDVSRVIALDDLDGLDPRDPDVVRRMAAATSLPSFDVDARTARRVAQGVQLGRHEVRGAPPEGLIQLVRGDRLVALIEAIPGVAELRTSRVFLEGTKS